jgi:hypothetical protein
MVDRQVFPWANSYPHGVRRDTPIVPTTPVEPQAGERRVMTIHHHSLAPIA